MSDNKDLGPYNEQVERQRMLNNLSKNGMRTDDKYGILAWNICITSHELYYKQEELFAELVNLITRVRKNPHQ